MADEHNQSTEHKEEQTHTETHTETTPTPEGEPQIKWGRTIASIVVIVIAAGLLGYLYREKNKEAEKDEGATPPPPQVVVEAPVASVTPTPTTAVTSTPTPTPTPTPTSAATPPPPSTTSNPNPTPTPTSTQPTWSTASHSDLGFQYRMSSNWTEVKESMKLAVYVKNTTTLLATIERFNAPNDNLDTIKAQLKASPEIHSIENVTVNGQAALKYKQTNTTATHYAFLSGGKVFYIADYTGGEVVAQFKTL